MHLQRSHIPLLFLCLFWEPPIVMYSSYTVYWRSLLEIERPGCSKDKSRGSHKTFFATYTLEALIFLQALLTTPLRSFWSIFWLLEVAFYLTE
jgi:hypothetical protein